MYSRTCTCTCSWVLIQTAHYIILLLCVCVCVCELVCVCVPQAPVWSSQLSWCPLMSPERQGLPPPLSEAIQFPPRQQPTQTQGRNQRWPAGRMESGPPPEGVWSEGESCLYTCIDSHSRQRTTTHVTPLHVHVHVHVVPTGSHRPS